MSLSELNVGTNDLEEIPPSIGLLQHLRMVYADENFIAETPPKVTASATCCFHQIMMEEMPVKLLEISVQMKILMISMY